MAYTPEGEPFPLKPGQTWFEVVSQYTELDQSGQIWKFHFQTPPIPKWKIYLLEPGVSPLEWFYEDQNPGKVMPWNGVIETPEIPEEGDSDPENFEPEDGDSNADNFESPDLDELAVQGGAGERSRG